MNDELQSKLAEVLGGIADGVSQAKDFAVEQLPDVAQQYIMFGMVWETAALVVSVIVFALSVWLTAWAVKKMMDDGTSYQQEYAAIVGGVMGGFGVFVFGITSIAQLHPFLLVWFAPKLYLLQGIAGLLK
jgi:hypothetical protein